MFPKKETNTLTRTSTEERYDLDNPENLNRLINIGCGDRFHKDWENIDLVPFSSYVKGVDIRAGLPYPDNSFQVAYSSHMLEHLDRKTAENFTREVFRILKKNGIFRVLVPDLEQIVRIYLGKLEELKAGNMEAEPDYNWISLELFDQMIRQKSGGEMAEFLTDKNIKNKDFIRSRIGLEVEKIWNDNPPPPGKNQRRPSFHQIMLRLVKWLVRRIAGKNYLAYFKEGIFRNSGEVHRWMYDAFSLGRILKQAGFEIITVCKANQSCIPNFPAYGLEITNGNIAKPDSLFVESIKPGN